VEFDQYNQPGGTKENEPWEKQTIVI